MFDQNSFLSTTEVAPKAKVNKKTSPVKQTYTKRTLASRMVHNCTCRQKSTASENY
jgi:hypothetical protein